MNGRFEGCVAIIMVILEVLLTIVVPYSYWFELNESAVDGKQCIVSQYNDCLLGFHLRSTKA